MGGGAMWRTVTRMVASPPSSTASSRCTTAPAPRASASSARVSSGACQATATLHPASQISSGQSQYWEPEDWEFAGVEERDRLVFGSLPSRAEVEEATSDLQNALRLGIMGASPMAQLDLPASATITEVTETSQGSIIKVENEEGHPRAKEVTESDCIQHLTVRGVSSHGGLRIGARSGVVEAFHQLQNNPQVQGIVMSLATDKAVWDAVLKNEKIQEFRRTLLEADVSSEDGGIPDGGDGSSWKDGFSEFFCNTRRAFSRFMENFWDLITRLFDGTDNKPFAEESGEAMYRTLKSCMMLAVLVSAIVLFKRSAL